MASVSLPPSRVPKARAPSSGAGHGQRRVVAKEVSAEQRLGRWRTSSGRAPSLPTLWFYGAVAVSALLIVATALYHSGLLPPPIESQLIRFTLTGENKAGAWWSGMLLALLSLHALDGHALLRRCAPGAAKGWAMIGAVLLFLSADEVGSFHERLASFSDSLGLGAWSLILPLGALLATVLGRALVLLWAAGGEQRRKVWPVAIGFLLLGSVAPQELLEHRIEWQTDFARAVRAAIEEGTELTGMLVLLATVMAHTPGLAVGGAAGDRAAFAALWELRRPLTIGGLALAPILAIATVALAGPIYGRPADWLTAVAWFAAGLATCQPLLRRGRGLGLRVGALLVCCLASVAAVAVRPDKLVEIGPVTVSLRMLVLGLTSLLVSVILLYHPRGWRRACPLGAVALGLLAAGLLVPTNLIMIYLLSQLLGLAAYWVSTTAVPKGFETTEQRAPNVDPAGPDGPRGSAGD